MAKQIPDLRILRVLETISAALVKAGEPLTATRLKRDLGIDDSVFWAASEYGCKTKHLKCASQNYHSSLKPFAIPEIAYYSQLMQSVAGLWKEEGYEPSDFFIEDTSAKDSKIVGPWVRPDFTLLSHKKFAWTIGNEFDVVTFEVKRPDSCNVLAVFEALAHTTAATRGYVIFPLGQKEWEQANPKQAVRVRDECSRHGIGLILVDDILGPSPVASHFIKATRRQIDHEKCSSFLEAVLSPDGRSRIAKWK